MLKQAVEQVLRSYPRIFFACHARHVRDPRSRAVLTDHQASILDHLSQERPRRVSDLAEHMGVTPATMSVAIARLARLGYVRRKRDPQDGRAVGLFLTASGVRIVRSKSVLEPDRVRSMLRRLAPGERKEALRGLALLARAAEEETRSRSTRREKTPAGSS